MQTCTNYICDDNLREIISQHTWYHSSVYPRATISGYGRIHMHTFVWHLVHNEFVYKPDHINRNPLDNRIDNLRKVSATIQGFNRDVSKSSDLPRGVSVKIGLAKPYMARIRVKGVLRHLGYFADIEDAEIAYKIALIEATNMEIGG